MNNDTFAASLWAVWTIGLVIPLVSFGIRRIGHRKFLGLLGFNIATFAFLLEYSHALMSSDTFHTLLQFMTAFGSIGLVLTLVGWSLNGIGRRACYGAMILLGVLVVVIMVLAGEVEGDVAVLVGALAFAAVVGGIFGTILFRSKPRV